MKLVTLLCICFSLFTIQGLYAQEQNELFWKAAKNNDLKSLQELLDKGVDVNIKTQYGATALMYATDKVHPEAVNFLLLHGADPNAKDTFYGATPFLWAFDKGNEQILKDMINHGADLSGEEPMMYSIYSKLLDIQLLLIEKGAKGAEQALLEAVKTENSEQLSNILALKKFEPEVLSDALLNAMATKNQKIISQLESLGAILPDKPANPGQLNASMAGTYKSSDENTIVILLKDSTLSMSFNGSPDYPLESKEGYTYGLANIPGITVSFDVVQDQTVSLLFSQGPYQMKFFKAGQKAGSDSTNVKPAFTDLSGEVNKQLNWPSFRGTDACGIADGQYPPLAFDGIKGNNLLWKTSIPGLAHSSPIVWNDRIFLTTAMSSDTATEYKVGLYGDVQPAEDMSSHLWKMYCLDRKSGKILWEKKAYEGIPRVKRHPKGTQANATPVTNGEYVVALFGSEGLVCYDMKGNEKWRKDLGVLDAGWFFDEETQWGPASSPIIYKNTVIVQCDRSKDSYMAAYDLKTGSEVWKVQRDEISSWGTPTLMHDALRDELITNATKFIRSNNPATGEEYWHLSPNSEITVGTPVVMDKLIYVSNGYAPLQPVYAIKPGGKGNISIPDSLNSGEFIQWRTLRGGTYMPTLIGYQGYLYTLNNNGALTCYDARTGEKKYKATLKDGQAFTASPVAADGKLYFTSEEKGVIVVKAGPDFEQITINPIGEICMATPAISDGCIFIRGQHHLFCFKKK